MIVYHRTNDKRCGGQSANTLAPVELLKLVLIAPHRQQWDNRRDQVYVTETGFASHTSGPNMCDHDKTQNPPNNHTFFTSQRKSAVRRRRKGNFNMERRISYLECVRATSLFRAAPGGFLHFCEASIVNILAIYTRGAALKDHT